MDLDIHLLQLREGREGGRERGREGGRQGGREGGREGREGEREAGREGWRERGREGGGVTHVYQDNNVPSEIVHVHVHNLRTCKCTCSCIYMYKTCIHNTVCCCCSPVLRLHPGCPGRHPLPSSSQLSGDWGECVM